MGNNSSSWFSIKTSKEEEEEKKKIKASLTEYDNTMNTIKRENMFKGTIIICIVYAIFGFLLLLLSYFSDSIRDLLFNKFLAFTLVYIIGSIVIIFIMLYYIYTFEPVKINRYNEIDDISCPDYWKVEIIDDNYIGDSFDSNYTNEFKYRCVLNDDIFDKANMFKYHNNINYRMTNNFNNINNSDINKIGKYKSSIDANFNTDYKINSNLYNLYVDVNNYSTNKTGTETSFLVNKKNLTKDLNIYNDSTRVDNIYSNLRKISLLQNNYEINNTNNNATNLLLKKYGSYTKQIFNPDINFSIWPKNNNSITNIVLSAIESNNALQIINWNNITKNQLDNLFLSTTTNYNVVALKIGIETTTPGTYYCLGLIKKDSADSNKFYYYPTQFTMGFRNTAANYLNAIFPYGNPGSLAVSTVLSTNVDQKNLIFKTTKLFKIVNTSTNNDYNDYNNISSVGIPVSNIRIDDTGIPGPRIQAYDTTKYNVDNITKDNLHGTGVLANDNYQVPLLCDAIYPKLFARFEKEDTKNENHNDIRCAYSKICGIPWSDLRCPSN